MAAPRKRRRSTRIGRRVKGSLWLAGVVTFLVLVNVYVFLVHGGTSIMDIRRALAAARIEPNGGRGAKQESRPHAGPAVVVRRGNPLPTWRPLARREELAASLGAVGVGEGDVGELLRLCAKLPAFDKIRAGAFAVRVDGAGRLVAFELKGASGVGLIAERSADGKLHAISPGGRGDGAGGKPRSKAR